MTIFPIPIFTGEKINTLVIKAPKRGADGATTKASLNKAVKVNKLHSFR